MKKIIINLAFFPLGILTFLISCEKSKSTNASGIIFSKHHVPMPFLTFTVDYSRGGHNDVAGTFTLATNAEGFFQHVTKGRRYLSYTNIPHLEDMHVNANDSGSYHGGFPSFTNVEIILK